MVEDNSDWDPFALLLIDVQKDFWTTGMEIAFPDFQDNVTTLLRLCREEGIDVIHLRAVFREDRSDWMLRYLLGDEIPCIEGKAGAGIFDCAAETADEPVIRKQTFDGFLNPELQERLAAGNKKFLLMAGLVTSVCVLLTAAAASQRGYLVGIVEDCCADKPEAHLHTLERYPFVFEQTTTSSLVADRENWLAELQKLELA